MGVSDYRQDELRKFADSFMEDLAFVKDAFPGALPAEVRAAVLHEALERIIEALEAVVSEVARER